MTERNFPEKKPRRGSPFICVAVLCLLFVALFLTSCAARNAATPAPTRATALPGTVQVRESIAGAERTVDVLYVRAHIEAEDAQAAIDGRDIATEKLSLAHCASYVFDGQSLTAYTSTFPQEPVTLLIAEYSGVSLSNGGDNVLEEVLSPSDGAVTVPLALDESYRFYTVDLGAAPSLSLWYGDQENGGEIIAEYTRTTEDGDTVEIRETHHVELVRHVPLEVKAALGCD